MYIFCSLILCLICEIFATEWNLIIYKLYEHSMQCYDRWNCDKFGWNWLIWILKKILSMYFCYFDHYYLPSGKGEARHLLHVLHPRIICSLEICPLHGFGNIVNVFYYFKVLVFFTPWERVCPFIWINLNPLHTRMLCAKFGRNWSIASEEDF